MPPNMNRCTDCGKLFAAAAGKTFCDTCLRNRMTREERVHEAVEVQGLETPHDIALAVGIPLDDVAAILTRLNLPRKEIKPEALCARCKHAEASQGSTYCLGCRTELDQQFGEAARTLEEKIAQADHKRPAKTAASGMSARKALEQKRMRTTDQGHINFRR